MVISKSANNIDTEQPNSAGLNFVLKTSDPKFKTEFEDPVETKRISKHIQNVLEVKVFKKRWLQLVLFVLYSANIHIHQYQYTIINNIICKYYNVSSLAVEWTSIMFMVMYLILIIPCSYLVNLIGLRWSVVAGAMITCLGAWMKVFSVSRDCFVVTLISQAIIAVSETFTQPLPGLLAARWFGPKQTALATTIACSGITIGYSVSHSITPTVVQNRAEIDEIGQDLSILFWSIALFSTIIGVALLFFFEAGPRLPPSDSRALQIVNGEVIKTGDYLPSIKRILSNNNYLLLWNSDGIIIGVLNGIIAMLNPLYLPHFRNGEKEVGELGSVIVITGTIGSLIVALALDKIKKFREIALFLCSLSIIGEILFAVSLFIEIKWMVFATGIMLGGFLVSYTAMDYELSAETTYPEPENIATGLLFVSINIFSPLIILISGRLFEAYGDRATHAFFILLLILGTFLIGINKSELRRQKAAENAVKYKAVSQKVLAEPAQSFDEGV
ncbi:feline leukemia virus subgroup C receptor-related protein 2-like [Diprion similis]|uniref:feline leukemia virus subgroup C receptor-related protein 2-like n=1 Tax=Diprion similis TaxID=362088 RepID=UPI001EF81AF9|nr:feline leukemia virus subgroup C receptor-related protein 2-like [Diprion similis]